MNYSNLGYLFELRRDLNGNLGLKEDFKYIYKGTEENPNQELEITLTAGIDFMGNLLKPAYNSISEGFIPLQTHLQNTSNKGIQQATENFCKSHKPWFSIINKSFYLVVDGKITFDLATNTIKENGLSLYAPKTTSDTYDGFKTKKGDIMPSLLTYKVDEKGGFNKMRLNKVVLDALYQHILNELEPQYCINREQYTVQRMLYQPIKKIPTDSWVLKQDIINK